MNLSEYRTLFTLVCVGLLGLTTLAVATSINPYPRTAEKFFAVSLLGKDKSAEEYYPDGDPNIFQLEEIQWFILVQNFMEQAQYVSVRVKVLDSTMAFPDMVACTPSPENAILDFNIFLADDRASIIRFSWCVSNYSLQQESLVLERLVINDMPVNLNVSGVSGFSFYMIFELWYLDSVSREFRFEWDTGLGLRCAWNQMLFNVTV